MWWWGRGCEVGERRQCEFHLLRYVPDPVRNEYVHIGVLLREARVARRVEDTDDRGLAGREGGVSDHEVGSQPHKSALRKGAWAAGQVAAVRFTRDWRRVRCLDPDADTELLEGLEGELRRRFASEPDGNLMHVLEDSFSNSVQMTAAKGYLAESVEAGVEELMRLYVEPLKRERQPKLSARAAIHGRMRSEFERVGVWDLLRKRIPISEYTRTGDPLRIDCGYRPNGVIRMFHAVPLEPGLEMVKVLAFAAEGMMAGVERVEKARLELTAVIEPWRGFAGSEPVGGAGWGQWDDAGLVQQDGDVLPGAAESGARGALREPVEGKNAELLEQYRFAVETMEERKIRVLTTADLGRVAETARRELVV